MSTANRVALVTGAGSGIGRAAALALQGDGYDIVLAGRRAAELERTTAMAAPNGGRLLAIACDVTDQLAVRTMFARTRDAFGRLDVLFNNAGLGAPLVPLEELSADTWRQVVDVNLTGVFLCCQEALKLMKSQDPKGGRIINNGSISAHTPRPNSGPYTATKHAITGLTKAIALDGRDHRIACSQIDIGNAATEMTAPMAAGIRQPGGQTIVEPRMDVADVARAVLFMANLPLESNVLFMTIKATEMPYEGRG